MQTESNLEIVPFTNDPIMQWVSRDGTTAGVIDQAAVKAAGGKLGRRSSGEVFIIPPEPKKWRLERLSGFDLFWAQIRGQATHRIVEDNS